MQHAAVLVRGPALVPRDVQRDQPEHSLSLKNEVRHLEAPFGKNFAVTRKHNIAKQTHPANNQRFMPQRGNNQEPSAHITQHTETQRPSWRVVSQTVTA